MLIDLQLLGRILRLLPASRAQPQHHDVRLRAQLVLTDIRLHHATDRRPHPPNRPLQACLVRRNPLLRPRHRPAHPLPNAQLLCRVPRYVPNVQRYLQRHLGVDGPTRGTGLRQPSGNRRRDCSL